MYVDESVGYIVGLLIPCLIFTYVDESGKLLKIFAGLRQIIMKDPNQLRQRVSEPRYKAVVDVVNDLSKHLGVSPHDLNRR